MRRALLALFLVTGCRQAFGIPEGGRTGEDGTPRYPVTIHVRGAHGVSTGTLELSLDGSTEKIVDDGDFTFSHELASGEYDITHSAECSAIAPFTVDGGPVDAGDVFCDGLVSLRAWNFSAPLGFEPQFDPSVSTVTYHAGSKLTQNLTVTPVPEYDTATIAEVSFDHVILLPPLPYPLGNPMGSRDLTVTVHESHFPDRKYIVTLDGDARPSQASIANSLMTTARDHFGTAIALDGTLLAVGAAGKVAIFRRAGGTWIEETTFADIADPTFGASVAVASNVVFVGAPAAGKVHVYRYAAPDWTESTALVGAVSFGTALATNSMHLFVGEPAAEKIVSYTFAGVATGNHYESAIAGDGLGTSLAATDTYVAAGAPDDPPTGTNGGAVFVMPPTLLGATRLQASHRGSGDRFGAAVALDGNVLVVGTPGEDASDALTPDDNSAVNAGAVYVFEHSTAWAEVDYLKAEAIDPGDAFGASIAIDSRILVVGAPYDDSRRADAHDHAAPNAGAVYIYPIAQPFARMDPDYTKPKQPGPSDTFGASLALGVDALLIGAPLRDSGAVDTGAVYIFQ